jgi:hypothetical protein
LFGAIFNSAIADELAQAPDALRVHLPQRVDAVIGALHDGQMHGVAEDYLRHAMYVATHHIYFGMVIVALCTLAVVLLTPRRFAEMAEQP